MLPITHNCRSVTHRFEFWHRLEICASSWHIFQAIKRVDGHLVCQQNKIGKVQNLKKNSACLTTFLSAKCNTDWFKCHFWQLYFKAYWSEVHFLSKLSLPFYTFVFTAAEHVLFLHGLHVQRSTQQQSLMKILSLVFWKYYHWGREKY